MAKDQHKLLTSFFEYETGKVIQITSIKVGIMYKIAQLCILGYFIGYVMLVERGYQDTEDLVSTVLTKVKGSGYSELPGKDKEIWDVADYVVPPLENNAFFVTTNAVTNAGQVRGTCPENPDEFKSRCKKDADCKKNTKDVVGNGIPTGRCLPVPAFNVSMCEIRGWCPAENDTSPLGDQPLFPMVENYTVLIKNFIEFPKFKVKRRNILKWTSKKFLRECRFDPHHPQYKFCPIFTFKTIFDAVNLYPSALVQGAAVAIKIHWECNLDWDIDFCNPEYSFQRLDDENALIAKGLNFRYAQYYYVNGTKHRDLIKAAGIRFVVFVTGKAGKFGFIPFTMNVGSGLALLGLASVFCDMIVLNIMGDKDAYRDAKFEPVGGANPKRKKSVISGTSLMKETIELTAFK